MEQLRVIYTDLNIKFAWFHEQIIVLGTADEIIGYSGKFESVQFRIERSEENVQEYGKYSAFMISDKDGANGSKSRFRVGFEESQTFKLVLGTEKGYIHVYELTMVLDEDGENNEICCSSVKFAGETQFGNYQISFVQLIDGARVLLVDCMGKIGYLPLSSQKIISMVNRGIEGLEDPLKQVIFIKDKDMLLYVNNEKLLNSWGTLDDVELCDSQVIYPDPVEHVEYQEANNVLVVASSSNTISIVLASSGGILCSVDFSDLGKIRLLKTHPFAPIVILGFERQILVLSFKGVTLFEYSLSSFEHHVLNSIFWLNNHVTLGINLIPSEAESMETLVWLQLNVGSCTKKICPSIIDGNGLYYFGKHLGIFEIGSILSAERHLPWKFLEIPDEYYHENSAIKFIGVEVENDGHLSQLAVACNNGFCLYRETQKKWKLFGNRLHEDRFSVTCGFAFCQGLLFSGVHYNDEKKWEIVAFSPDERLDLDRKVVGLLLDCEPVTLASYSNNLIVFSTINLEVFIISPEILGNNDNQIELKGSWKIPSFQDNKQGRLVKVELLFSDSLKLFAVQQDHRLVIYHRSHEKDPELCPFVSFNGFIDYFSVDEIRLKSSGKVTKILWLYNGNCLSAMAFSEDLEAYHLFDVEIENIVTGVFLEYGALTNITYKSGIIEDYQTCDPITQYRFIIPELMHGFIVKRKDDIVQYFIGKYSKYPYFVYCMELLLHTVLELESDSLIGLSPVAVLPRLVSILSSLPDYHEIVVNCARKSEVSLWKYLFSVVGDPLDLFDECMRDEKYECATSYLVILYTMEPSAVSAKESVRLLEATLKSEKYQISSELMRFLKSISMVSDEASQALGGGEKLFLDLMIERHFIRLLRNQRWRSLFRLAKELDFPLESFLTDKKRLDCDLSDSGMAITKLHEQFQLPFPQSLEDSKKSQRRSFNISLNLYNYGGGGGGGGGGAAASSNDGPVKSPSSEISWSPLTANDLSRLRRNRSASLGFLTETNNAVGIVEQSRNVGVVMEDELRFAVDVLGKCGWIRWKLLFALILLDVEMIREIVTLLDVECDFYKSLFKEAEDGGIPCSLYRRILSLVHTS